MATNIETRNVKSIYEARGVVRSGGFGQEVSLSPCIGPDGKRCPMLSTATFCNGGIDVGIGTVYCTDKDRGGRPVKLTQESKRPEVLARQNG